MLDGFDYLNETPDEIYVDFFKGFQPEAIAAAFLLNKRAKRTLADDSLWKTHLTHLRAFIQEQDCVTTHVTYSIFAQRYAQYFHLLAKMQQDEINHFMTIEPELRRSMPEATNALNQYFQVLRQVNNVAPAKVFEELLTSAQMLDGPINELNAMIIRPLVAKAREDYQDELNLDEQKITRIPESVIEDPEFNDFFQNIESLRVNKNPLTKLPLNIGKCANLKILAASNTSLAFLPYNLAQLPQLNTLIINSNHILALPENIGDLSSLQRMFAANNQLTHLPGSFAKLKQLNALNLSNNALTECHLALPRLLKLGLNANYLHEVSLHLARALYCFEESKLQSTDQVLEQQQRKVFKVPKR